MAIDRERYYQLLVNLLPIGRLWDTRNQPVFRSLIESIANELCRVDERVDAMLRESDPRLTTELIDDWERLVGLPDECTPIDFSLSGRRAQVAQKYTNVGGLSADFYEKLGLQLGQKIAVKDFFPFRAGRSQAGDALTNNFETSFKAGDKVGSQLRTYGWRFYINACLEKESVVIECTLKKLKPAHVGIIFTYA